MANPFKDPEKLDAFLATPRLAILMMNREDPAPIGVPVWFEWNGTTVEMFAEKASPKIARLERDPNVSVLATNAIGEPEAWVAFDGTVAISPGGIELAERLAERYWDMSIPDYQAVVDLWRQGADVLCRLSLTPSRIRGNLPQYEDVLEQ